MDGGPLAQFRENFPAHSLDPGVLRGFAGVGYIEINHGPRRRSRLVESNYTDANAESIRVYRRPYQIVLFQHSNGEE